MPHNYMSRKKTHKENGFIKFNTIYGSEVIQAIPYKPSFA